MTNLTNFVDAVSVAQAAGNTGVSMFYSLLPAGLIVVFSIWGLRKFFKVVGW